MIVKVTYWQDSRGEMIFLQLHHTTFIRRRSLRTPLNSIRLNLNYSVFQFYGKISIVPPYTDFSYFFTHRAKVGRETI